MNNGPKKKSQAKLENMDGNVNTRYKISRMQ
jgi:hypothetical protein